MLLGNTVIKTINIKIYNKFFAGIVKNEMYDYRNSTPYNYALELLLIEPNYRQYGFN
jgi:hypothetical protein